MDGDKKSPSKAAKSEPSMEASGGEWATELLNVSPVRTDDGWKLEVVSKSAIMEDLTDEDEAEYKVEPKPPQASSEILPLDLSYVTDEDKETLVKRYQDLKFIGEYDCFGLRCCLCEQLAIVNFTTPCHHIYCSFCLNVMIEIDRAECVMCGKIVDKTKVTRDRESEDKILRFTSLCLNAKFGDCEKSVPLCKMMEHLKECPSKRVKRVHPNEIRDVTYTTEFNSSKFKCVFRNLTDRKLNKRPVFYSESWPVAGFPFTMKARLNYETGTMYLKFHQDPFTRKMIAIPPFPRVTYTLSKPEEFSDDGKAASSDSEEVSDDGKAFPGDGKAFPGDGKAFPGDGKAFPGDGKAFPGDGKAFLGDGKAFPGDGKAKKPTDAEETSPDVKAKSLKYVRRQELHYNDRIIPNGSPRYSVYVSPTILQSITVNDSIQLKVKLDYPQQKTNLYTEEQLTWEIEDYGAILDEQQDELVNYHSSTYFYSYKRRYRMKIDLHVLYAPYLQLKIVEEPPDSVEDVFPGFFVRVMFYGKDEKQTKFVQKIFYDSSCRIDMPKNSSEFIGFSLAKIELKIVETKDVFDRY